MEPRLRRVPGVLSEELDGQMLLLAPGRVEALHLDEVATTVWHLLDGAPTLDELAGGVAEVYAVEADRVRADLAPVLATLTAHGVVEPAAAPCA